MQADNGGSNSTMSSASLSMLAAALLTTASSCRNACEMYLFLQLLSMTQTIIDTIMFRGRRNGFPIWRHELTVDTLTRSGHDASRTPIQVFQRLAVWLLTVAFHSQPAERC